MRAPEPLALATASGQAVVSPEGELEPIGRNLETAPAPSADAAPPAVQPAAPPAQEPSGRDGTDAAPSGEAAPSSDAAPGDLDAGRAR
jgi:hypothetical protein